MLSIKPVIQVSDGIVAEESKQRTRSRSLEYLASKLRDAAPFERLAVCDGAAADLDKFLGAPGAASRSARAGSSRSTSARWSAPTPVPGTIGVCYELPA